MKKEKEEMTQEKFLATVAKEVKALKKTATKAELDNLDFSYFDPRSRSACIYGQITGDYRNTRALKLIRTCCVKSFHTSDAGIDDLADKSFAAAKKMINGKFPRRFGKTDLGYTADFVHLSFIEGYIAMKGSKPENIINYLKGKTKDLVL